MILVVDDEPVNRLLVSATLGSFGYEVVEAGSASQALHFTQERHPELILLDLSMPEMDGAAFLKALRGELKSGAKVALYTASVPTAAMRDFMTLFNIEYVIPKPCEPEEMLRIVREALSR